MNFIIVITLFLSAFLGGLTIFLIKKDYSHLPKLILSFSGAYLFSITILHLIPEVYKSTTSNIGVYILAGFLFQLILEQFSAGIEHGHIHKHAHINQRFPAGIMFSLCLHAFLEGMPLSQGYQSELLFGIAVHHVPAAFALASFLAQTNGKKTMLIALFIFALMSPLGFLFSDLINQGEFGQINQYFDQLMAIVIGIFLHISTTILFESSIDHHFNRKKWIAVILGISISFLNFLFY